MQADRLAKLEALLDKQEIMECLGRFSRGIDRFDRDVFMSAFWPDGQMAAGPFVGTPEECMNWSFALHEAGQKATHHNLLNCTIDLDGDTAHSETYYLFVARNRDDSNWIAGGRYVDRLERRDGEWRIALRCNVIEWSGIVPTMDIPFADVADIKLNGWGERSADDISYRRPLTNRRERNIPG